MSGDPFPNPTGWEVSYEEAAEAYSTSRVAHRNDWTFEEYCERMAA